MSNQQAMNEKISYGVFWLRENDDLPFSDAKGIYNKLALNPSCKRRRIVERVETFEVYQEEQQ